MNPPTTPSELAITSSGTETLYPSNNTTQWGHQETVELIKIRGQLEKNFSSSKRFKALWETVASSLRDKGFFRTPHQCKSKWKNLVNRYKGKETTDFENGKQCPYFKELHAVFTDRAESLEQSFMDSQQVAVKSRKRSGDQFSNDLSQDDDEEGNDSIREGGLRNNTQKRKTDKNSRGSSSILEMLRGFLQQQERVELQWMESMERNQRERELFELEWRQSMEKLERERLMMEQAWMEREEQRLIREEIRAEKRDALLTSLLNKLIGQGNV